MWIGFEDLDVDVLDPGGSPNRVDDLSFEDKSSVQNLPKSPTFAKLGGKSSTQSR